MQKDCVSYKLICGFLFSAVTLGLAGCGGSSAPEAVWSGFAGNPQHTGYKALTLDPGKFTLRWSKKTDSLRDLAATPFHVVYSDETGLASLDPQDGSKQWEVKLGATQLVWPPVLGNGVVYVNTGRIIEGDPNILRAFSLEKGAPVFSRTFNVPVEGALPVYYSGSLYGVFYQDSVLLTVNATDGTTRWADAYEAGSMGGYVPAVTDKYVISYRSTGYTSGELAALNKSNGQAELKIPDPNFVKGEMFIGQRAPVVGADGAVYVTQGNRLMRFNLNTAAIDWEIEGAYVQLNPLLANGVLYARINGHLEARRASDGALLWSATDITEEPIVVTSNLLFLYAAGQTVAVNLNTHKKVWSYPVGGNMAIQNGTLYVNSPGKLYAFDLLGDTDGDGLPDYWENRYGGVVTPGSDTDKDGLTALQEFQQKLNPTTADTDGDGIMDADEILL